MVRNDDDLLFELSPIPPHAPVLVSCGMDAEEAELWLEVEVELEKDARRI